MLLSPWSLHAALSALAIVFLAGFTAQLLVRRPLAQLWPTLPLSFFAALLFSIGDLASVLSAQVSPTMHWVGLIVLYTGLLLFAPTWWAFTLRYVELYAGRPMKNADDYCHMKYTDDYFHESFHLGFFAKSETRCF